MNWRKPIWRIYKILERGVCGTRINRLPLGNRTLGNRLGSLVRRFFAATLSSPMTIHGHKMYLHPLDVHPLEMHSSMDFILGTYEQDTRQVFERTILPGMTVVDLGAHIGFYTLLAARLVGSKGRVYAFEPEPSNLALLVKNVKANGYDDICHIVGKAVFNEERVIQLFMGERSSGEASMYVAPGVGSRVVAAEATTLDAFFESEGWPPVHLIKMDIEGAEKAALEGARALIERNPGLKLIMEFSPGCLAVASVSPEELFDTLLAVGFNRFYVIRGGKVPLTIPQDVVRLVKVAEEAQDCYVNLFCET